MFFGTKLPKPLFGIARGLHIARRRDARCDLGAALGRRREDEVGGAHRLHLDMEVDAVEQRPRQLRLIIGGAARRTAASERGVAELAPAARSEERRVGDECVMTGVTRWCPSP